MQRKKRRLICLKKKFLRMKPIYDAFADSAQTRFENLGRQPETARKVPADYEVTVSSWSREAGSALRLRSADLVLTLSLMPATLTYFL